VIASIASRPPKPVRSAESPRKWLASSWAGPELVGVLAARRRLLDRDHLRVLADLVHDVVAGALARRDVERLDGRVAVLDGEGEPVLGAVAAGVGHLDRQPAAGAARQSGDAEGAQRGRLGRAVPAVRASLRLAPAGVGVGTADAHHVRDRAAVVQVAVHGVREVAALGELTERRDELRPVLDQHRGVERAGGGEADEGRHRRTHALDGA
jgi:hypothetical protein